jgi:hypothetical protein
LSSLNKIGDGTRGRELCSYWSGIRDEEIEERVAGETLSDVFVQGNNDKLATLYKYIPTAEKEKKMTGVNSGS